MVANAKEQDPPTLEDMLQMRLEDLIKAETYTTEHFQFKFCSKLVEVVPGLLTMDVGELTPNNSSIADPSSNLSDSSTSSTAASSENVFEGFENACNELKHHLETSSDPIVANDIDLCHHLEGALKDRFVVGLPSFVTNDSNHFCTWFVDQVFPSEIEPPCMLFMETLQYKHAVKGED